jgi:hypothetical protein
MVFPLLQLRWPTQQTSQGRSRYDLRLEEDLLTSGLKPPAAIGGEAFAGTGRRDGRYRQFMDTGPDRCPLTTQHNGLASHAISSTSKTRPGRMDGGR